MVLRLEGREVPEQVGAALLLGEPLPRSRPLWAAVVVTRLCGGRLALVVMHHVLAEGLGGLAVLEEVAAAMRGRRLQRASTRRTSGSVRSSAAPRMLHTLVSNVGRPDRVTAPGGSRVSEVIPAAMSAKLNGRPSVLAREVVNHSPSSTRGVADGTVSQSYAGRHVRR